VVVVLVVVVVLLWWWLGSELSVGVRQSSIAVLMMMMADCGRVKYR